MEFSLFHGMLVVGVTVTISCTGFPGLWEFLGVLFSVLACCVLLLQLLRWVVLISKAIWCS